MFTYANKDVYEGDFFLGDKGKGTFASEELEGAIGREIF